jgi:diguanylate cyclase (GGDEF)-like protein
MNRIRLQRANGGLELFADVVAEKNSHLGRNLAAQNLVGRPPVTARRDVVKVHVHFGAVVVDGEVHHFARRVAALPASRNFVHRSSLVTENADPKVTAFLICDPRPAAPATRVGRYSRTGARISVVKSRPERPDAIHMAVSPSISDERAPDDDGIAAQPSFRDTGLGRVAIGSVVAVLFSLSLLVASYVLNRFSMSVTLAASALVLAGALVVLMTVFVAARELLYWRLSTRSLARLVNELRAGEAPIGDLDRVKGGTVILVEPLRSILLDLREAKRTNIALQEEMRSRILSRTDALERQLGTLKTQAARDVMTGLGNRRAYDTMSQQIFKACAESHQDLCALMIDVDNFKPLNDTLGHAAGDELLKSIGEIIRSSIREHDSAYRVGGDEFVILLPRASRAIGDRLAGRLASLVDHLARPLKLPHPPALSIGTAALSDETFADSKQMMDQADRRLYAAKAKKPQRMQRNVA